MAILVLLDGKKGSYMTQNHYNILGAQQHIGTLKRSPLLQRHPVLAPVLLLCGSLVLGITSCFADTVFPALAFLGTPSALLCLAFAFVLGIAGIIASIITMIECVHRHCLQAALFLQPKEHSYANRN
jgi:hypothetical protein